VQAEAALAAPAAQASSLFRTQTFTKRLLQRQDHRRSVLAGRIGFTNTPLLGLSLSKA
jgi:hypothetical protein